jgi:hypothetical protein
MTDDRMALIELIEKDADADLIREMLAFAAGRVMELEATAQAGAAKGARGGSGRRVSPAVTRRVARRSQALQGRVERTVTQKSFSSPIERLFQFCLSISLFVRIVLFDKLVFPP